MKTRHSLTRDELKLLAIAASNLKPNSSINFNILYVGQVNVNALSLPHKYAKTFNGKPLVYKHSKQCSIGY
jgi:hypothetical protein